ncbi:MAG: magnesium chelatase subunit D family protein [Deltaproteobacteria bacterium]|nr:MAG: magnesium chelatase subunit D family protein [Deltaproteobacteria bacterium]
MTTDPKNTRHHPLLFPFTAIVGQEEMKKALLLCAVNPGLSGLLIRGHKGTAKSTAVRSLINLLPEINVVSECVFGCNPAVLHELCDDCQARLRGDSPTAPDGKLESIRRRVRVVDLPLNSTEDRVVGSINFEYAVRSGKKRFQPGILAEANRGIIYIDEVNLLDDYLVDIILDTAATGVNIVEREGISYSHPARFILIATMNPEEGELRPQLLDRFGLSVNIKGIPSPRDRVEIIKRRESYESAPVPFIKQWEKEEQKLAEKIVRTQKILDRVEISPELLVEISRIASENWVAGHRADIVMERTARTIAAFDERTSVSLEDIREAAEFALPHRARQPLDSQDRSGMTGRESQGEELPSDRPGVNKPVNGGDSDIGTGNKRFPSSPIQGGEGQPGSESVAYRVSGPGDKDQPGAKGKEMAQGVIFEIRNNVSIGTRDIKFERDCRVRGRSGRRSQTETRLKSGRYVRSTAVRRNDDLAFDATLRAAAPHQRHRRTEGLAVAIDSEDIREKIRERRAGNLLVFVVDGSGSMGTRLMSGTKGTIMSLLLEAYQKRDKVSMVTFKGKGAEVLLPPTNSIELAKRLLEDMPTGGKTPLCHGLIAGYELIAQHLRKEPNTLPLMIIVTDGRANVGLHREGVYEGGLFGKIYEEIYRFAEIIRSEKRIKTMVIDTEEKKLGSFGRAQTLSETLNAKYYLLQDLIESSQP